jgi:hypothetical protein
MARLKEEKKALAGERKGVTVILRMERVGDLE